MSAEPYMWATFCDDIRQEVGNKLSYLGVYGPQLVVQSFPTTLMKLCCVLSLRIPLEAAPKHVTFRLLRDEEVLFEAVLPASDFQESTAPATANSADFRALTIVSVAQLLAFPITQRCLLKARAIVDEVEVRGGTLELLAANQGA